MISSDRKTLLTFSKKNTELIYFYTGSSFYWDIDHYKIKIGLIQVVKPILCKFSE